MFVNTAPCIARAVQQITLIAGNHLKLASLQRKDEISLSVIAAKAEKSMLDGIWLNPKC